MDTPLLSYALTPSTAAFSGGPDRLSVVDLVVTATNATSADVTCSSITLTASVGTDAAALTTDPSTVAPSPGSRTPWAVGIGAGTWVALPLPPVTTVPAGTSIELTLAGVVINEQPGTTTIQVAETTDATRTTTVALLKDGAAPPRTPPTIGSFTAEPDTVAQGGTTVLTWSTTGADRCVLGPGAVGLPNPAGGSFPVAVDATRTFTLDALGGGGRASAEAAVVVGAVAIDSFTADPPGPVAGGTAVTLRWATRYAASCSIDQGVGPVDGVGSVVVTAESSRVYTLSALGRGPLASTVTVLVTT